VSDDTYAIKRAAEIVDQLSTIGKRRKLFKQKTGPAAAIMVEAMRDYLQARREGVSQEDGVLGIEAALRDSGLFKTSKFFQCERCDGTGLIHRECPSYPCQRPPNHAPHTYGEPCECTTGDKWRPKSDDDKAIGAAAAPRRGRR
jgi:hypothetical protein